MSLKSFTLDSAVRLNTLENNLFKHKFVENMKILFQHTFKRCFGWNLCLVKCLGM